MTTCSKVRYDSLNEAAAALATIRRDRLHVSAPGAKKPTRAYRCRVCGGHHLTSQPISGAPERPSERSSR